MTLQVPVRGLLEFGAHLRPFGGVVDLERDSSCREGSCLDDRLT